MMRNNGFVWLLSGLIVLLAQLPILAQPYGNEWINPAQRYLKIPIAEDGIYKVSRQELQTAGWPVENINPTTLQLYHRGVEQAIYVAGETDAAFDAGDYLLFYGQKNDGTLDTQLYKSPEAQPHTYYNLYSDTTAYFLTYTLDNSSGKRMASFAANNTSGLAAESAIVEEVLQVFANNYNAGIAYPFAGEFKTYSAYGDFGEGFTGPVIANGASRVVSFSGLGEIAPTGPAPEVSIVLNGRNNLDRDVEIYGGNSEASLSLLGTAVFSGGNFFEATYSISRAMLAGGNFVLKVQTSSGERVSIALVKVRFPGTSAMEGVNSLSFSLPAGSASQKFLEFPDAAAESQLFNISDANNLVRIGMRSVEGSRVAVIPNGTIDNKLLLINASSAVSVIKPVSFRELPTAPDFLMVTHASLRAATSDYTDPVQAYADYRASAIGGGYSPLLMNVDEVFNYFSYGEVTSLGIRNLARYYGETANPGYLFLVGKALTSNYNYYRQAGWTSDDKDLVPTFGYPGADIPFVTHIKGSGEVPAFAVGRITARTPADVEAYLNKIKETEALTSEQLAFRKQFVHLSGGTTRSEANAMRSYLSSYAGIAEGLYAGAHVQSFSKTEEVIVQEINISESVNKGVGLITFFGHSGADITDIEIGFVTNDQNGYHNKGLYPSILVNGCSAGQIFANRNGQYTFGEDWMLAKDRGSLSFIAHSGTGYTNFLRTYSGKFYEEAFTDSTRLDDALGTVLKATVQSFLNASGTSDLVVAQAHQMVLQGDPAHRFFNLPKLDYAISSESMLLESAEGQSLTLGADSIAVQFTVNNLGSARADSVLAELTVSLEGGEPVPLWEGFLPPIYYSDTIKLWFLPNNLPGAGELEFTVNYNVARLPDEYTFINNRASFTQVIRQGGAIPLLPANFALQPKGEVSVFTQLGNLLSGEREVQIEIDTLADFTSVARQSKLLPVKGIANWRVDFPIIEDTVTYFWRTKLANPSQEEDGNWVSASFTQIKDAAYGWMQRKVAQLKQNTFSALQLTELGNFNFPKINREIMIEVYGPDYLGNELPARLEIDGIAYIRPVVDNRALCADNSMNAFQLDGETLELLVAQPYGLQFRESCGALPQIVNNFVTANVINGNNDGYNLEGYLGGIEEGNWVYLFTIGANNYSQWPQSLRDQFLSFGYDPANLADLLDGEPFIIRMKKGGTSADVRVFRAATGSTSPLEESIVASDALESNVEQGSMLSTLIGPAQNWGAVAFDVKTEAQDNFYVQVISLDAAKNEQVFTTVTNEQVIDLSTLDAGQYPFIKLKFYTRDVELRTPAQLRFWQVSFTPLPEGILLAGDSVRFPLAVNAGDQFSAGFRYVNISEQRYAADSLPVKQEVLSFAAQMSQLREYKISAPAPGDTTFFSLASIQLNNVGLYGLNLSVNNDPEKERVVANNSLSFRPFAEAKGDTLQPAMDVVFDGIYITNGTIVSPDPLVGISVRDDKAFFQKNDSTSLVIKIRRHCDGCEFEQVNLKGNKVQLQPAAEGKPFKVDYRPGPLEDGMYTLQVQAMDESGNRAGEEPYAIDFEVINESSITHFYPYPNPFSTSTRFVFTLTGGKVPEDIKIQIMTQSGRVVREIFKEELGPIRIGHNISQYAWDGKDEWGGQLANGIYFYRVLIQDAEISFSHRETTADRSFHKELGKLYLLR